MRTAGVEIDGDGHEGCWFLRRTVIRFKPSPCHADNTYVYVAIDLVLILAFAGVLAGRGLLWRRRGQATDPRFVQREFASWLDRVLDVVHEGGDAQDGS